MLLTRQVKGLRLCPVTLPTRMDFCRAQEPATRQLLLLSLVKQGGQVGGGPLGAIRGERAFLVKKSLRIKVCGEDTGTAWNQSLWCEA